MVHRDWKKDSRGRGHIAIAYTSVSCANTSLKGDAIKDSRTLKSKETAESMAPVHSCSRSHVTSCASHVTRHTSHFTSFATTLKNTIRLLNKVRRDSISSGIRGAFATDARKGTSSAAQRM